MIYLFIILIVLALLTSSKKYFDYIIIAFLGWLTTVSTNAADFTSYENIYYVISSRQLYETGYGWYILNAIGRFFNLNYAQFKGLLTVMGLLLLLIFCKVLLGRNYNYIWGLYLLYPALINVVQIRFFIAMAISTFALIFLLANKFSGSIIYFLLINAAITIHSGTAFYLIFLLIPIIEKNKKIFSWILIIGTVILIPLKKTIQSTISFFATSRQTSYFENTNVGSMMTTIITVSIIIIFYLLSNRMNHVIQEQAEFNTKEKKSSELINEVNLCLLILVPAIFLSTEFARVQRIAWFLMYVEIAILSTKEVEVSIGHFRINSKLLGGIIGIFGFCVMIMYLAPLAFSSIF